MLQRHTLFALLAAFILPSLASAQYVRHPDRYLLINPPRQVVQPVVVHTAPSPERVVVVHQTPPPPHVRVRVETHRHTETDDDSPRWFLGPSYRLDAGVTLGQVEFGFRFDLAPSFQQGEERAALYTAGAGFGYRFLEDSRVHPVIGLGLESVFFNPAEGETSRAFALNARIGMDLDVPTHFGHVALGLDVTGHQPLAGDDAAQATLLGIGAHFGLYF